MRKVVEFNADDIKSVIGQITGAKPSDVVVSIDGKLSVVAPSEYSEDELAVRVDCVGECLTPKKWKDQWHPYSVVIWNEDDGVPSGTTVVACTSMDEAREYVRKSFSNSLETIQNDEDFKLCYYTEDYNEHPESCFMTWESKNTNTSFSSGWCITENAAASDVLDG